MSNVTSKVTIYDYKKKKTEIFHLIKEHGEKLWD
jgi:hypothetical protein